MGLTSVQRRLASVPLRMVGVQRNIILCMFSASLSWFGMPPVPNSRNDTLNLKISLFRIIGHPKLQTDFALQSRVALVYLPL